LVRQVEEAALANQEDGRSAFFHFLSRAICIRPELDCRETKRRGRTPFGLVRLCPYLRVQLAVPATAGK
jgi:hypothetical protein